jgi:hypothetical protein
MANSFQFVKNKILNFPKTYIRGKNQSHSSNENKYATNAYTPGVGAYISNWFHFLLHT